MPSVPQILEAAKRIAADNPHCEDADIPCSDECDCFTLAGDALEAAEMAPPGSQALKVTTEIAQAWDMLEASGFPPEFVGWPFCSVEGKLPEAISCALDCLIRQRNDLLAEVLKLREQTANTESKRGPKRSRIAAKLAAAWSALTC